MDFEKEYIPDEQEDFDTDFDTEEITPIKSLRSDPPLQYFTNINSVYCKDVAGREELDELKALVDDVPWQPLEDGYSNFWFELTEDTLSPWLNFSAKNNNAVIDWGDGSGEVALDTLTPTHTYSKAGRYVVKVKGVTGIAAQMNFPIDSEYCKILKAVELNSDVTTVNTSVFRFCSALEHVDMKETEITTLPNYAFMPCTLLTDVSLPSTLTTLQQQCFYYATCLDNLVLPLSLTTIGTNCFIACVSLKEVTIPQNVSSINNSAFNSCSSLATIHVKPTTPPTFGTNVFAGLPSFIIYVPVGTAETYKSAAGWDAYADHILEEGQTPNRAMLAKFNSTKTDESEVKDDELYQDENR